MRPTRTIRGASALLLLVFASCNSGDTTSNTSSGPIFGTAKFEIGLPASATIRRGSTTVVPITIIRTAYTGFVFVTFSGLPTGVVAPSLSSTATDLMNVTLTADAAAALGSKTVTVNANGSDVAAVTGSFSLTVTASQ
jgi:hypothetical protein